MSNIALQRLLAPVMRGIRLLFGRGVLTGVNDGLKAQNVQLTALDGETFDEVERPQQYGHISVRCCNCCLTGWPGTKRRIRCWRRWHPPG